MSSIADNYLVHIPPNMSTVETANFFRALKTNGNCRILTYHEPQENEQNFKLLAEALKTNAMVSELSIYLDSNRPPRFISNYLMYISSILDSNHIITSCNLQFGQFNVGDPGTDDALKRIANALKSNGTLKSLTLPAFRYTDDACRAFAAALGSNRTLTHFGFSLGAQFNYEGFQALTTELRSNSTLTSFAIGHIVDGPAKDGFTLFQALIFNTTLTHLSCGAITISPSNNSSDVLIEALRDNCALTSLSLENCSKFDERGMLCVAAGLRVNRKITELKIDVSECNANQKIVQGFAIALKYNSTLTSFAITVKKCQEDLDAFCEMLKVNHTLTHLEIGPTIHDRKEPSTCALALKRNRMFSPEAPATAIQEFMVECLSLIKQNPSDASLVDLFNEICAKSQREVIQKFYAIMDDPDQFTLDAIERLFRQVVNAADLKFPFTLASMALKSGEFPQNQLITLVRQSLRNIAENFIYSPRCAAHFKMVLKAAERSGMLNVILRKELDGVAENSRVFNDPRFVSLAHHVGQLFKSVDFLWLAVQQNREEMDALWLATQQNQEAIARVGGRVISLEKHVLELNQRVNQNAEILQQQISGLKHALHSQAKRRQVLGIAKLALNIIPLIGPVVGHTAEVLMEGYNLIVDFSDTVEVGAHVLGINTDTLHELVKGGEQFLAVESNREMLVKQAFRHGDVIANKLYNPSKLVDEWAKGSISVMTGKMVFETETLVPAAIPQKALRPSNPKIEAPPPRAPSPLPPKTQWPSNSASSYPPIDALSSQRSTTQKALPLSNPKAEAIPVRAVSPVPPKTRWPSNNITMGSFKNYLNNLTRGGYRFFISKNQNVIVIECVATKMNDPDCEQHLETLQQHLNYNLLDCGIDGNIKTINKKLSIHVIPENIPAVEAILKECGAFQQSLTDRGAVCPVS